MKGIDLWRLCEELSVSQAALLVAGHNPEKWLNVEELDAVERPEGYEAVKSALKGAIYSNKLTADVKHQAEYTHFDYVEDGEYVPSYSPDWNETIVKVKDLRDFLSLRGCKEGFFFEENKNLPDYLDPSHPNYTPKLGAAINAWMAISNNADLPQARSIKTSIIRWLEKNAESYGLTKEDGSLNDLAIKEIAKVANWDIKGGAPTIPAIRLAKDGVPANKLPKNQSETMPSPKALIEDNIPY